MDVQQARHRLKVAKTLLDTGIIQPVRPSRAVRSLARLRRWGPTAAGAYAAEAARHPNRTAIVDERGTLTFAEVHRRTNALACELGRAGIGEEDGVAIMCRNHRGFIEATVACSKLGAGLLYLNTAFAGPQITDVIEREDPVAVIYDEEFAGLVRDGASEKLRFLAWSEGPAEGDGGASRAEPRLEELIARGDDSDLDPPLARGRVVLLTSGTTGTPKGAPRTPTDSMEPAASLFSKIPLRAGETTMIAAPMFHSWGFAHLNVGLLLGSTLVLRRKFDPEETLRAIAEHRASTLAVVPVMLQRMMDLGERTIARYDLHSLRVIALSGSVLPGELATRAMDAFGDVLYNLYGSTEVAWATIATPADMRAAPGTAGAAADGDGRQAAGCRRPRGQGRASGGRIFVGNEMMFEGYTDGGGKEIVGGFDEHR